ncbi:MAG: sulfatase maturation enzyme AslB (radical SAM superfamily) [Lysobacterales bacterium]|jgi:sulfatase maturation enzyme AslB (radical SAM superfamily)
MVKNAHTHSEDTNWLKTPMGDNRGYIQPQQLKELWFHTGTICNLSCPFCLEGSKPGDDRLNKVTLGDVVPFIDEALELGVEKFSFTGGEPFVIKDMVKILDYALEHRPCLVLSNATRPLQARLTEILPLLNKPHDVSFRISFDFPDAQRHDEGRGAGNFDLALNTIGELYKLGFNISIARHREANEDVESVDRKYIEHFKKVNIPNDTRIVSFPDFSVPGIIADVPHITEGCMTKYHTEVGRSKFMCSFSKMVVKKDGHMRVYACTLVDDDSDYDTGSTLMEALKPRITMKHHRCYSCFADGASCSEM